MYPAHFAAGLAAKGCVKQSPLWALITAAFLPDLLWVVLALAGIEPEYPPRGFFDDWSHSLLSILVLSTFFALPFWYQGREVAAAVWCAGMSHVFLDLPIHPARLALYPHSRIRLGWSMWQFGQQKSSLGPGHYWLVEAAAVVVLLSIYIIGSVRAGFSQRLVAASSLLVAGLHLLSL